MKRSKKRLLIKRLTPSEDKANLRWLKRHVGAELYRVILKVRRHIRGGGNIGQSKIAGNRLSFKSLKNDLPPSLYSLLDKGGAYRKLYFEFWGDEFIGISNTPEPSKQNLLNEFAGL